MHEYFELIYYFFAFVPGVSINILLAMMYIKYRNSYTGLFMASYMATSLLVFYYLSLNFFSNVGYNLEYEFMSFIEVTLMFLIMWFLSKLIIKVFYDNSSLLVQTLTFIFSSVPVLIYVIWFFNVWKINRVEDIYYLYFIAVLVFDCVLFLMKYKNINNNVFRKLGVAMALILSLFIILFIAQSYIPGFAFDTFPVFYLIITVLLIDFLWKKFIKDNVDGVFNVNESFIRKYNITKREKEIIELIQKGHSNSIISKKLFVSEKTIANHIYNIYKKLDISSRFELICLFKK